MKMVKSLLLGTAAGLVAMTGAQAADLPVKAKPVQYVKICSLYGAGFYYIPGTDMCLKMGGWVRAEYNWNANGSFNPQVNQNYNRNQNELVSRSRLLLSTDVRSQTEYGTLRAFGRFAFQWTTGDIATGGSMANNGLASGGLYVDRAFIQLGGWTFGKTESFMNFTTSDFGYTNNTQLVWNDTGGSGVPVLAYTAQFGNGLSATLALEDHWDNIGPDAAVTTASLAAGGTGALFNGGGLGTGGPRVPDLVGNLRVDQAWGSAQIEGALVNNNPAYYSSNLGVGTLAHPDDKLSGAIGGGIKINLPMLGAGDSFGIATMYCSGASHYCGNNASTASAPTGNTTLTGQVPGNPALFNLTTGQTTGFGQLWDGFYVELSRTWNINGGIQHNWNPAWRTSLWAGYINFKANSSAVDAACAATTTGSIVAGAYVASGVQGPGCMDWNAWQIGSRTMWNPVANMDVSLEVMYTKVHSALAGSAAISNGTGTVQTTYGDNDTWSGILRFQRNFWP
jgi:hypothetical protein